VLVDLGIPVRGGSDPWLRHLMGSAFAIENDVSGFSDAFSFAPLWLFAAADIGASLVAAGNLLFGHMDRNFLICRHGQAPLDSVWIVRIDRETHSPGK